MSEAAAAIAAGYTTAGEAIELGSVVIDNQVEPSARVRLPLAMLNRHGLVAGATGTGKTKTLQLMAEQLSAAGVPVVLADVKGDLSGIAAPGVESARVAARSAELGTNWTPAGIPVEYLAFGEDGTGVPIRATVASFGPVLLAKILKLNDTQESVLSLIFHWAVRNQRPLVTIADLRTVVLHLTSDAGKADLAGIGGVSTASAGVILRNLANLEASGADKLFGTPELDIHDLMRTINGKGVVTLIELANLQTSPATFTTFLMWLMQRLFETLPEAGDLDKPKLVFFFDEAHLLFNGATQAFVERIEQTVKLIRSKGVGIFFCTQLPTDIPNSVLSQLGARIQHAIRAFTADDQRALVRVARTYPRSKVYDLESALTSLGIGEAIVTVLSETGAPTPVAWTRLRPPQSLMGPVGAEALRATVEASPLAVKYAQIAAGPVPAVPAVIVPEPREEPSPIALAMTNDRVAAFLAEAATSLTRATITRTLFGSRH